MVDKNIGIIKKTMKSALKENGEWECHDDIPDEPVPPFDDHFTVIGESERVVYLVCIERVELWEE